MKQQYIIIAIITLVFVSFAFPLLAQLGAPQVPQISLPRIPSVFTDPPTPPAAPVDGGLSLLIAAGAGYGIKKLKEKKNKQNK